MEIFEKDRTGSRSFIIIITLGVAAFVTLVRLFWVGFLGSDDVSYWGGATGWLTEFPYVGQDHWTLRHTVVLPIAIARIWLGSSLMAMALPTVLYAVSLVILLGLWTARSVSATAAAFALAILISNPQLVLWSSTADVDIPETFFIVAALFILDFVIQHAVNKRPAPTCRTFGLLMLVGVLGGLAVLSRETATFAVASFGILWLFSYGLERRYYFWIAAGGSLTLALDTLWLWTRTGNWLYRSTIDINHDSGISRWVDQGASLPFLLHPLFDPFTMLLLNHNFGLLTWIGVPLVTMLFFQRTLSGPAYREAVLLSVTALTWTIFCFALWKLLPLIPRYYLLPSVMVCVVAGIALSKLWDAGRRKLAISLASILVSANLVALALDNGNYMFGVYTLVDLSLSQKEVIHTDPNTSRRANLLLDWSKTRDRVTVSAARKGDLFFYNPTMAPAEFVPNNTSIEVRRYVIPENGGRWLACHLPAKLVGEPLLAKFKCSNNAVLLVRMT